MSWLDSITGLFDGIDPDLASAGIFSVASLLGNSFGSDVDEGYLELARDKFEQDILNSAEDRLLSREELAARERIAGMSAGATVRAAGISAAAQKEIARRGNQLELGQTRIAARDKAADRRIKAREGVPDLIMQGRSAQAQQARATGEGGRAALESIMAGIQGALKR